MDDCLARNRLTSGPNEAPCRSNACASGTHEGPAKRSPQDLGRPSLRLGLLVSAAAHALLAFGVLCTQGMHERQELEPVIMMEFADLAGSPGLGAAGGAGLAVPRPPAGSNAVALAKRPLVPAGVNLVDKTARQQVEPSQAQEEHSPAQGVGVAGAEVSSAVGSQGDGLSGGAGPGVGGAAGGISGGAAVGTAVGTGWGAGRGKVDSLPRVTEKVKPVYPDHARRMHKTGVVTLKFLVDAEGRVHQASVMEASPQGLFEESALAAIARWRFAPAMRQGSPVPTWLILPVRFTLEK